MTISEFYEQFFIRWNNKTADYDGYYGGQCYDLAQFWSQAIGGKPFIGMYAKDIYTQTQSGFYVQQPNTPSYVPQVGDIIVWAGSYNGGVGHVGVATGKGDINTFECFEQNDPIGTKCHLRTYNYDSVIGGLRAKMAVVTPTPTDQRAYLFDVLIHATESPTVDTLKMTLAQVNEIAARINRQKVGNGKLDLLIKDAYGTPVGSETLTWQQIKAKTIEKANPDAISAVKIGADIKAIQDKIKIGGYK